jgi:hypothetical protein
MPCTQPLPEDNVTTTSMIEGPSHGGSTWSRVYTDEELRCENFVPRCEVTSGSLDDYGTIGGVYFNNQIVTPRPDGGYDCSGLTSINQPTEVAVVRDGNSLRVDWSITNSPLCGRGTSGWCGMQGVNFRFYWTEVTPPNISEKITPDGDFREDTRESLEEALDIIDSIHGAPDGMEDIKITDLDNALSSADGTYQVEDNDSESIQIKRSEDKIDTIIHEMGHWLDHQGLSQHSDRGADDTDLTSWGSSSSLFDDFHEATKKSKKYNEILKSDKLEDETKEYLLSKHETWARAYTQFIAEESGNDKLNNALKKKIGDSSGSDYNGQWSTDDFQAIKQEVRKILENKGLLKPKSGIIP